MIFLKVVRLTFVLLLFIVENLKNLLQKSIFCVIIMLCRYMLRCIRLLHRRIIPEKRKKLWIL